jgi:hypothetical protein
VAKRSDVHPTKSDTCPSPISTTRLQPSRRSTTSTEKNLLLIRLAHYRSSGRVERKSPMEKRKARKTPEDKTICLPMLR